MGITQEVLSDFWSKFDGTAGLAFLFLFFLTLQSNSSVLRIFSLTALIFFGIAKGIISNIITKADGNDTEERFRNSGKILLGKLSGNLIERMSFYTLFISGGVLLVLELYIFFLGAYLWVQSGLIESYLITILWVIFSVDMIKNWAENVQSEAYREFVVDFNRRLPGKTFWPDQED